MKFIEKINMASEDVQSYLVSGKGYNGTTEIELFDGAVVTIGDLCDHEVYGTTTYQGTALGLKDMNTRKLTLGYTAGSRYGIVDYVGVNEADVMSVKYRVGDKVLGLAAPAGVATRVRTLQVGDTFFLGNENFDAAPAAGLYTPSTTNAGQFVANSSASTGLVIKVEFVTDQVMGMVNACKKAYCTVMSI